MNLDLIATYKLVKTSMLYRFSSYHRSERQQLSISVIGGKSVYQE